MDDKKFVPLNTTIRVRESELLSQDDFNRMLEADSFEEAANVLRDTPYSDSVDQLLQDKDVDSLLLKELERIYQWLYTESPSKEIIQIITLKYAYHNLKVIFKEDILNENLDHLYIDVGRYPLSDLRQAVHRQESDVLPEPYITSIREAHEDYEEYGNIYAIDVILDRRYLTHYRQLAEYIGRENLIDKAKRDIDFENIITLLRAVRQKRTTNFLNTVLSSSGSIPKKELISYAEEDSDLEDVSNRLLETKYGNVLKEAIDPKTNTFSLMILERVVQDAQMKYIKQAKLKVKGPEPLIAYIVAKETEVKNLRLVFAGKEDHISNERIKERLLESYVL